MSQANHESGHASADPITPRKPAMMWRDRLAIGIIMIGVLAAYALACLPGQIAPLDWAEAYFLDDYQRRVEHGWPFTFLVRDVSPDTLEQLLNDLQDEDIAITDDPFATKSPPWQTKEGWRFAGDRATWNRWAITGNILVAALSLIVIALACRWRVRQRESLFRFTLLDAGLAAVIVSAILAWWRQGVTADQNDLENAKSLGTDAYATRRFVGPEWLARLVGSGGLPFWRTIHISLGVSDGVDRHSRDPIGHRELSAFEHLEYVDFWQPGVSEEFIVEVLQVDAIRRLDLTRLPAMNEALQQTLRETQLPMLVLFVVNRELKAYDSLDQYVSVQSLHLLDLSSQVPEGLIAKAALLPRLERLNVVRHFKERLPGGDIGAPLDLRPLVAAKRLRELKLNYYRINEECVNAIIEMKGLKKLVVSLCVMNKNDRTRLQAARPDLEFIEVNDITENVPVAQSGRDGAAK